MKGEEESEYFWGQDGFGLYQFDKLQEGEVQLRNLREEPAVDFLLRITEE